MCLFFIGLGNVGNLFSMAGEVNKALGDLVHAMTDDEGSGDEHELRRIP